MNELFVEYAVLLCESREDNRLVYIEDNLRIHAL